EHRNTAILRRLHHENQIVAGENADLLYRQLGTLLGHDLLFLAAEVDVPLRPGTGGLEVEQVRRIRIDLAEQAAVEERDPDEASHLGVLGEPGDRPAPL